MEFDELLSHVDPGLRANYSATVSIRLYADGREYDVGNLGPGFAYLRFAEGIDASEGEIELVVDHKVKRWKVRFTAPITTASKRFTFEAV